MAEQRMLVLPEGHGSNLRSVQLQDPKSGATQTCMMTDHGHLLEVTHHKVMYSSWLMGDSWVADGGLYLATPLDPLFPLLPKLEAARAQGGTSASVWVALDQILDGSRGSGAGAASDMEALLASARPQLECVGDVKEVDGDTYFRLNDDKVLAWLLCKHDLCKESLAPQLAGLDKGGQDAYAASFLAEYLTPAWSAKLAKHLCVDVGSTTESGHKHQHPAPPQPQDKRPKLDMKQLATEAANKKAAQLRLLAKQATAAKAAAGNKKMTQFFAAKPAAPTS